MVDFHLLITDWYRQNKRELPWRDTKNPYLIWLSEIILQQTRVNQGMSYYLKFVAHYPTVDDLAAADEQAVLADWQGLGYYSRARNLHHAAKTIASEFGGNFPDTFEAIRQLKGIGDYTAAAIASFAFDLPHAVVDGNVFRVLSRVFDIATPIDSTQGKKEFDALAASLLDRENPALYNQAIMEFGALQCVPSNPDCGVCPLADQCLARRNYTIRERPRKQGKTAQRDRFFHYLWMGQENELLLEKRMEKDIWQHLYQFPVIETDRALSQEEVGALIFERFRIRPAEISAPIRHILSHQRIHALVWKFDHFPDEEHISADWIRIRKEQLPDFPIPRLLDRYLEEYL